MHDKYQRHEGGRSLIATLTAFAGGIAIGLNLAGGYPAAASEVRAPVMVASHAPVKLPALPVAVTASLSLGPLVFLAADQSRECSAGADDPCIFN